MQRDMLLLGNEATQHLAFKDSAGMCTPFWAHMIPQYISSVRQAGQHSDFETSFTGWADAQQLSTEVCR